MDDDLELVGDEATRAALDALRAAYVSAELPKVGLPLAAVFVDGLPGRGGVTPPVGERAPEKAGEPVAWPVAPPAPAPAPEPAGEPRARRWLGRWVAPSKSSLTGLAAAAVAINLVAVGSAGLLPRPLQSSFERVTRSVGLEIPEADGVDHRAGDDQQRRGTVGEPGTQTQAGGAPGGQAAGPPAPSQGNPQTGQAPGKGGRNDRSPGSAPRSGSTTPRVIAVPTTRPQDAKGAGESSTASTVPCVTTTVPPTTAPPGTTTTVATLPPPPTTTTPPIAGDAPAGVPGPPGTLPVTPPPCPPA